MDLFKLQVEINSSPIMLSYAVLQYASLSLQLLCSHPRPDSDYITLYLHLDALASLLRFQKKKRMVLLRRGQSKGKGSSSSSLFSVIRSQLLNISSTSLRLGIFFSASKCFTSMLRGWRSHVLLLMPYLELGAPHNRVAWLFHVPASEGEI